MDKEIVLNNTKTLGTHFLSINATSEYTGLGIAHRCLLCSQAKITFV
jgi:hypothetical protein